MMETEDKNICLQGEFLPCICDTFPEKFRLKAEKDLNETKRNVEKGLGVLRDCIKKEKLNIRRDANFLLPYLRQAKFNFKKAEEKLKLSNNLFSMLEELVESSNMDKIQAVIDHQCAGVLPFRDRRGWLVGYARACAWRKELFDLKDVVLTLICLGFFFSNYPLTSACGLTFLADAKVNHLYDLLPIINAFRTYVPYLNMLPFRVQRVDIMNSNFLCRYCYAVVRPFLPTKIKNRVYFYGKDFECLQEIYPASILPFEFGGTIGPLSPNSYRDQFLEFVNNFISEIKQMKK